MADGRGGHRAVVCGALTAAAVLPLVLAWAAAGFPVPDALPLPGTAPPPDAPPLPDLGDGTPPGGGGTPSAPWRTGPLRHWPWVALALTAPVLTWGAWPLHRAALRAATAGWLLPETIASVACLAALARGVELLVRTPVTAPGPGLGAVGWLVAGCCLAACAAAVRSGSPPAAGWLRLTAAGVGVLSVAAAGFALGAAGPVPPFPVAAGVLLLGAPVLLVASRPRRVIPAGITVHPMPDVTPDELVRHAAALHHAAACHDPLTAWVDGVDAAGLPGVSDLDGDVRAGLRGVVSELRRADRDSAELLFPELTRTVGETVVVAHAVLIGPEEWLLAHGVSPPRTRPGDGAAVRLCVAWDGVARGTIAIRNGDGAGWTRFRSRRRHPSGPTAGYGVQAVPVREVVPKGKARR